jgi:hypothetical protein
MKMKTQPTTGVCEAVGKKNLRTLLVGMQTSATTLETILFKHKSAMWSSNPTPRDIPKGMQLRLLQRHLHNHVYCNAIHNSQDAPLLTNGLRKCGIYTQWNFTQPWRRMNSYHLQVNGWNWRTSSWARLARLRRPKIICSSSYANFRSRAKAVMLLELGHILRGEHIREEWG